MTSPTPLSTRRCNSGRLSVPIASRNLEARSTKSETNPRCETEMRKTLRLTWFVKSAQSSRHRIYSGKWADALGDKDPPRPPRSVRCLPDSFSTITGGVPRDDLKSGYSCHHSRYHLAIRPPSPSTSFRVISFRHWRRSRRPRQARYSSNRDHRRSSAKGNRSRVLGFFRGLLVRDLHHEMTWCPMT